MFLLTFKAGTEMLNKTLPKTGTLLGWKKQVHTFFLLKYFSRLVISESHVDKLMGEEMKDSLRDPRDFNTWM